MELSQSINNYHKYQILYLDKKLKKKKKKSSLIKLSREFHALISLI